MKATWIAPIVLALATTPALAGEQAGATGQVTNSSSTSSQQGVGGSGQTAQQGGGNTDTTHEGGDTGTSGTSGIDNTGSSRSDSSMSSEPDATQGQSEHDNQSGDAVKSDAGHRTGTGSDS